MAARVARQVPSQVSVPPTQPLPSLPTPTHSNASSPASASNQSSNPYDPFSQFQSYPPFTPFNYSSISKRGMNGGPPPPWWMDGGPPPDGGGPPPDGGRPPGGGPPDGGPPPDYGPPPKGGYNHGPPPPWFKGKKDWNRTGHGGRPTNADGFPFFNYSNPVPFNANPSQNPQWAQNPWLTSPPSSSSSDGSQSREALYQSTEQKERDEKREEADERDNGSSLGLAIGIPVGIILLVVLLLLLWCWFRRRRRRVPPPLFPPPFTKTTNEYDKYDQGGGHAGDVWEMERSKLMINYEKKLGSGAFCNVFKGRIIGDAPVTRMRSMRTPVLTDADVAVKMLPSFADDIARSDFMQEINFMKSLSYHTHLVSMLGWVNDRKSPLLLVEYCEKGDLLHFIREKKDEITSGYMNTDGLKLKDVLSFSWQISNGLEYLNSVGCIHRDIAARNVLVTSENLCKIGDFGLCRLTDSLLYQARGGRLPLKWMAPEALSSLEYSFKSDVWSYGVLLWELFSFGQVPFASIQTTELLTHIQRGERLEKPEWATEQVYEIMHKCWKEDPVQRPSFTLLCSLFGELLEHATEYYGYLVAVHRTTDEEEEYTRPSTLVVELNDE